MANEDEALFSRIDPTSYFHTLQFADFAEAIRHGRAPAVDGREGRKSVALIEAIFVRGENTARSNYIANWHHLGDHNYPVAVFTRYQNHPHHFAQLRSLALNILRVNKVKNLCSI